MPTRRVLPLLLAVAGLIALAALAAHGHPLGRSRGTGPTLSFFDYLFTTFAIAFVAILVVFVWSLLGSKWERPGPQRTRMYWGQLVAVFLTSTLIGLILLQSHFHFRLRPQRARVVHTLTTPGDNGKNTLSPLNRHVARLRWDEIAIVAAFLAAAGVAAYATRKTKPTKEWSLRSPEEEIALALDDTLDDLRADPDVRRAIIAAYARMERALGAAGIPRRPSEAPYEYLSRALGSLHTSAASITRLTDLFELAKFSHHDPDESMREDAIAALVAVRDELRAPAEVAA